MSTEKPDSTGLCNANFIVDRGESVAHQIIGDFLFVLAENEDYRETAQNLRTVIFEGKPTEAALRTAMFGDELL